MSELEKKLGIAGIAGGVVFLLLLGGWAIVGPFLRPHVSHPVFAPAPSRVVAPAAPLTDEQRERLRELRERNRERVRQFRESRGNRTD